MDKTEEVVIPNWTMFGAKHIGISIHELEGDDEEMMYQSSLNIFLDDGSDDDEDRMITLFCDIYDTKIENICKITFIYVSSLFENISPIVVIHGTDGEAKDEIDLRKVDMVPEGQIKQ